MQVPYPVQVENGDIVQLFPGDKPKVIDKAPVGRIFVDGNISVGEESQSIKDRKNLSYNGFLEITIIINDMWAQWLKNQSFLLKEYPIILMKIIILFLI